MEVPRKATQPSAASAVAAGAPCFVGRTHTRQGHSGRAKAAGFAPDLLLRD